MPVDHWRGRAKATLDSRFSDGESTLALNNDEAGHEGC